MIRNPFSHLTVAVASLAVNTLSLAAPLFILQVYDRIIPNQSANTAALLALGVLVALILEAGLKILRVAVLGPMATRYEVGASVGAARHLFASDLAAFERTSPGAHMERLSAIPQQREHGSGQTLLAIYDLPFVFIFLWMIWTLGGPVVAVPVLGAIVLAMAASPASRLARRALERSLATDDQRYDFLISALSSLAFIKIADAEQPMRRRYESLQQQRLSAQGAAQEAEQRLGEVTQLIVQLATIATVVAGSLLILEGGMTVGGLSACTLLVGRVLSQCRNLILLSSRLQSSGVTQGQVAAIFQVPVRAGGGGRLDARKAPARLVLRDVVFAGEGAAGEPGDPVLAGVDLELEVGRTVGLVGDNGSGKTILLAIAAGLYQPSSGRIELGGHPLDDYSDASLRQTIALVSQQETLFTGSILENISMFNAARSDAALAAAERTGLADLIKALPKGFATQVGDGASDSLPRGVAQRISLARALTLDPRILLFDDANSAVDDQGDEKVAELFAQLRERCAVLFVSHRPSVLSSADRIVRLADGRISTVEGATV